MHPIDVRRAADRVTTTGDRLTSRHSFSFGRHYEPDNVRYGSLVAHNDDLVAPGAGYDAHPHRDMEIVTWVLRGSLVHEDSTGNRGVIHPGLVQRLSAGTGVIHSERNDEAAAGEPARPVRFVQLWVPPDEPGLRPRYAQLDVAAALATGELVPVASGMARHRNTAGVGIANRSAALHAARLDPGRWVVLPDAAYLHMFVAQGTAHLEGAGALAEGDAVRLTGSGGQRVTGTADGAEILVWEMHPPGG